MEVQLDKVISMNLNDPISQFDSTQRTYLVNMTALMTFGQFAKLADEMQKLDDQGLYQKEDSKSNCQRGGHCGY